MVSALLMVARFGRSLSLASGLPIASVRSGESPYALEQNPHHRKRAHRRTEAVELPWRCRLNDSNSLTGPFRIELVDIAVTTRIASSTIATSTQSGHDTPTLST
jgi:hypothetical protein